VKTRITLGIILIGLFAMSLGASGWADQTRPWPGLREHTPRVHAFVGARIVVAPGDVMESATLVIRDGNIVAVGRDVRPPADARIWDLEGRTIYAGLIDLYTRHGVGADGSHRGGPPGGAAEGTTDKAAPRGSPYWNAKISPERSAAELFSPDADGAKKLRSQGITLVMSVPDGGIITGTGALVTTGDGESNDLVVESDVALALQYETGGRSDKSYPGSLMGVMALIRQSFLDADWYERAHTAWSEKGDFERPETNMSLERLGQLKAVGTPLLITAGNDRSFLRSVLLAKELELPAIVLGSNQEYRRLDAIAAAGLPVILPLNFPETPSVKTPEQALQVNLRDLRYWYLAPTNARRLLEAGVTVALTGHGLKDRGKLLSSVRTAMERGLQADAALAALTVTPAQIAGVEDRYGSLVVGKAASFVITRGDLFDEETSVQETWVEGRRYVVTPQPTVDPRGHWDVALPGGMGPQAIRLHIKGKPAKPSGEIKGDPAIDLEYVELSGSRFTFAFKGDSIGVEGVVQMSAAVEPERLMGHGVWPDGQTFVWTAARSTDTTSAADTDKEAEEGEEQEGDDDSREKGDDKEDKAPAELNLPARYPDGAFGFTQRPEPAELVAFTNATIWTCGSQGVLENATLLVAGGKVAGVGTRLAVPEGAVVVDATGMHITPGIIDCHSHTAIDGDVNEGTQTISAEVRIGDVIDPDDISMYRQLAGGVTTSNILHGSANAIGGQNQVIKFRWGGTAEELKFADAPPGVKFALGENPKQSNWGEQFTSRYPQTRMGVEQIIRDAFQAAREYEARHQAYDKSRRGMPPRRDLELDAIVEVVRGDRLVHSHSYRQDEIEMLMRVTEDFGFRVATFQHVLEGYKVADQLAAHGAGGSSFSDWWAYKFEVYDAIPYNGALMYHEGVVVSFNSDSNELARRLNTEAAKAVKYGGVPPVDALKFVTLNAAIQLRIDHRVGSLEPGKDADFAVWNGPPLSTYSRCEQTWIDGTQYFDYQDEASRRDEVRAERALLIQRVLQQGDKKGGGGEGHGYSHGKPHYSCCEILEGYYAHD